MTPAIATTMPALVSPAATETATRVSSTAPTGAAALAAGLATRVQKALGERVIEPFVFTARSMSELAHALLAHTGVLGARTALRPLWDSDRLPPLTPSPTYSTYRAYPTNSTAPPPITVPQPSSDVDDTPSLYTIHSVSTPPAASPYIREQGNALYARLRRSVGLDE